MIPIYQTIVEPGKGNCMQAALASLFELDLDQVPHILKYPGGYRRSMVFNHFCKGLGYKRQRPVWAHKFNELIKFEGVRGVFLATVSSRTFEDATHAVLIDHSGLVIHDPNPNQKWAWEDLTKPAIASYEFFYVDVIEKEKDE